MKLEAYCGDYFVISKGESFRFGSTDSAISFTTSIMEKREFYKDGFNCFVNGKTMGYHDGFMLKATNKGVYNNDNDLHGQFIGYDVISGMNVNYIQYSGDREMDFEEAYKQALTMQKKLQKAFGREIDIFIYENQSYVLHTKFLINVNKLGEKSERRYCQEYEQEFKQNFIEYGLKKNVKQGKEQSIKMQNAILVACQKA